MRGQEAGALAKEEVQAMGKRMRYKLPKVAGQAFDGG